MMSGRLRQRILEVLWARRRARLGVILVVMSFGVLKAWGHDGPVNEEGCHQLVEGGIFHCHRSRGKITKLPEKQLMRLREVTSSPFENQSRSVADVKAHMAESQLRPVGVSVLYGSFLSQRKHLSSFRFWKLESKKGLFSKPREFGGRSFHQDFQSASLFWVLYRWWASWPQLLLGSRVSELAQGPPLRLLNPQIHL